MIFPLNTDNIFHNILIITIYKTNIFIIYAHTSTTKNGLFVWSICMKQMDWNQNCLCVSVVVIFFCCSLHSVYIFSVLQQVDDKYIRTIHLHSGGSGNSGSVGKNSHRAKTQTNNQSRDRHDSNSSSRARTLASQFSQSYGHGEYIYIFFLKVWVCLFYD